MSDSEELRDKRDHHLANFQDYLENLKPDKKFEDHKRNLLQEYIKLIDMIFLTDQDEGFRDFKKNRQKKQWFSSILLFIVGVFIGILPMFLYISSQNSIVEYKFFPNSVAYKKPAYVQMIKTQKDVERVMQSNIRDADMASVGSIIVIGKLGLTVFSTQTIQTSGYYLKEVASQMDKTIDVQGFLFIPDAILTMDPVQVQVIYTQAEVESAKRMKTLLNRELLEIGAAVSCNPHSCYTIAKTTLKGSYFKVISIEEMANERKK